MSDKAPSKLGRHGFYESQEYIAYGIARIMYLLRIYANIYIYILYLHVHICICIYTHVQLMYVYSVYIPLMALKIPGVFNFPIYLNCRLGDLSSLDRKIVWILKDS